MKKPDSTRLPELVRYEIKAVPDTGPAGLDMDRS